MKKRRVRRGVSAGTVFVLALTVALVFASGLIFTRLMGENGQISIDPKLLSGTLAELARDLRDGPQAAQTTQTPSPAPSPTATPNPEAALVFATVASSQATEAPTLYMDSTVTLTAVGQVMLGSELRASGKQGTDLYDFSDIFTPVSGAIGGADLSLVTLRSALSDGSIRYGDYCAPATLATALKGAGFGILNLGTDRILDNGLAGLAATRAILQQRSLSSAGAYTSQEEYDARSIASIGGAKVGMLSYAMSLSAAGEKSAPKAERAFALRLYDEQTAASEIAALRENGAEIVIVLAHWGKRGDTEPSKLTRAQAASLVKAGADVVLGTGPTSVHALETVRAEDGRTAFVAYSLGNFLVDDSRESEDITGIVLHLEMEWSAQTRALTFKNAWYMPTWIMRWKEGGESRFRVVPAGASSVPEHMTDSIYVNMKKSYQSLTDRLGNQAAVPRAE